MWLIMTKHVCKLAHFLGYQIGTGLDSVKMNQLVSSLYRYRTSMFVLIRSPIHLVHFYSYWTSENYFFIYFLCTTCVSSLKIKKKSLLQVLEPIWAQQWSRSRWRLCRNKALWYGNELEWWTMQPEQILDLWKDTSSITLHPNSADDKIKDRVVYGCREQL